MGTVGVKEMRRWLQELKLLLREDDLIVDRIIGGWERGLVEYKEAVEEKELTDLLEKLGKLSVPNETRCKQVMGEFEKAINAQMKARGLVVQYAGGTIPDEIWRPKVIFSLRTSMDAMDSMFKKIASLAAEYGVYLRRR